MIAPEPFERHIRGQKFVKILLSRRAWDLGATSYPLSSNVGELTTEVQLGCDGVFISFLSQVLEIMTALSKYNCVLQFVILLILALIILITTYFAFNAF
jgi:hypothetical protein